MAADLMKISIAAKGAVRKYVTGNEAVVPRGSTMSALVSSLHIPDELRVICMKDGKRMAPAAKLHDGDNVVMITILPGG